MLSYPEVSKVDKKDMLGILASLPEQLIFGLDRGRGFRLPSGIRKVFVVGMGGSAIAGDVFSAWTMDRRATDIEVIRDYRLPPFSEENDAVIAVSYSGNTEETLMAASQALRIGCRLIGVSSGGELTKFCEENRADVVTVPRGYPPRGAFGYLFGAISGICGILVIGNSEDDIKKTVAHIEKERKNLMPEKGIKSNRAKAIAMKVKDKTPIIYGSMAYTPIARRWQTQFNENAKILAWASCFPEANHNEIEGWGGDKGVKRFLPILLRDVDESDELGFRLDATRAIVGKSVKPIEIKGKGESLLSRMLSVLLLGDIASVYLAVLRKVDPYPVKTIEELKGKLKSRNRAIHKPE